MGNQSQKIEKSGVGIRRFSLFLVFPLILAGLSWARAAEEPFPDKPVTIIVPYGPGGTLDVQAKIIGDRLAEVLGQPFLRLHKAGGGGTLGTSFAAKAKPDGYTVVVATSTV